MGIQFLPSQNLMTIAGSTAAEKTIGSIAEVQVKRILENGAYFDSTFRNRLVASQIMDLGGVSTAVYRIPNRVVWSSDYDIDKGAKRQRTGSDVTTFQLNKILNFKLMIEKYDIERLMNSPVGIQAAMVGSWLGTATKSLIMAQELIFRQAIKTWCIAHYDKTSPTPSVLVVDKTKFLTGDLDKDKANIIAFQRQLQDHMVKRLKMINKNTVGTSKDDWYISLSLELYNSMLPAFTQFIDEVGAKALTNGTWYANSALGYQIETDFFLEENYDKTTDRVINLDNSWDMRGVCGFICHYEDWVNPGVFETLGQAIEPETFNIQWVGKYLGSLPMSLRGLSTIIMDHEPTAAEIAAAKLQCAFQTNGLGSESDWETYRCQLAAWDSMITDATKLSNVLTTTSLGAITAANQNTILAAVLTKNPALTGVALKATDITNTSATISCTDKKYNGTVNVTFTIAPTQLENNYKAELEQSKRENQQALRDKEKVEKQLAEAKAQQEALQKELDAKAKANNDKKDKK